MNRNIYSLLLMDDVVSAVDQLAYTQNTSRSNMVNQILADYLSVKTPEQRMRDIFQQIEALMDQQSAFQIQFQPSDAMLSVRTALAYKYRPTVRYSVELFRNDPKVLGELRVSSRTQSAGLLQMLDSFFRLWQKLEEGVLLDQHPAGIPCRIDNGRYVRTFYWPQEACTNTQLGETISAYIQTFDRALKAFFELDESNWKEGIEKIGLEYQKALQKEKILL
ncbi:MAG: hypothetical protein PHE47_05325 [Oscillospiraceae bacterium]|nr:hypothetical protein [Oscillospiraceae bacterium]